MNIYFKHKLSEMLRKSLHNENDLLMNPHYSSISLELSNNLDDLLYIEMEVETKLLNNEIMFLVN
jgi:hypothetical protein